MGSGSMLRFRRLWLVEFGSDDEDEDEEDDDAVAAVAVLHAAEKAVVRYLSRGENVADVGVGRCG